MSKYVITKENIENISFDTKTNELTINWWTGGAVNAVCGLKLHMELIGVITSNYKAPKVKHNSDYNEAF